MYFFPFVSLDRQGCQSLNPGISSHVYRPLRAQHRSSESPERTLRPMTSGSTFRAEDIYNHPQIKLVFDCFAACVVSSSCFGWKRQNIPAYFALSRATMTEYRLIFPLKPKCMNIILSEKAVKRARLRQFWG